MGNLNSIYNKIRLFCSQNALFEKDSKVLVALSGGADSVFLLKFLQSENYSIEAAHCNFHLRGEESMRDEQFVRELCKVNSIKLHIKDFNTERIAKYQGISIEMAARELRYNWFQTLLTEINGNYIAIAHHLNDNIETLILNLVRGTGIKGMRGIQAKNGNIVRPMLCISKAEIIDGLNELNQDYITDSTNLEDIYSRNKIRLEIIPLLKSINPAVEENLATSIENINEAYKIYSKYINQIISDCTNREKGDVLYINKVKLHTTPSPLSILYSILEPYEFKRDQVKSILQCNYSGKRFYSNSYTALINRSQIIIVPNSQTENVPILQPLSEYTQIKTKIVENKNIIISKDPKYAYIDIDKIHGNLFVRQIKAGDSFVPFGMKGRKLISDFLTDMKLNIFEKEAQIVLCDDRDILWVVGKRVSNLYKVNFNTNKIMKLKLLDKKEKNA